MQTQTLLRKEEVVEHEILLQGTIRAIREATVEMASVGAVVGAQGEVIQKIQRKITEAEQTLKRASKSLTQLVRKSKKRKIAALFLLSVASASMLTVYAYTLIMQGR